MSRRAYARISYSSRKPEQNIPMYDYGEPSSYRGAESGDMGSRTSRDEDLSSSNSDVASTSRESKGKTRETRVQSGPATRSTQATAAASGLNNTPVVLNETRPPVAPNETRPPAVPNETRSAAEKKMVSL